MINTPIMLLRHHDMWPSLNLPRKLQNKNFDTAVKDDLTTSLSQKKVILVLTCLEYDQELNTRVI
jgi:hypothetical protein